MKINLLKPFQQAKRYVILSIGSLLTIALAFQFVFLSADAIASPLNIALFGNGGSSQQKLDKTIDKIADQAKDLTKPGKAAKAIDQAANQTKDFAKDMGGRAKGLAKDVEAGTKKTISKTKDAAENAKDVVGNKAKEGLDKTKEISGEAKDTVNDKIGDVIDSVKDFLGE
jgi:hypothetical protein